MKLISRNMWPHSLETALRKACDSTATIIAWNAIFLLGKGSWVHYISHVSNAVGEVKTEDELRERIKSASISWDPWEAGPKTRRHAAIILRQSFVLFSDQDWKNYAAYLVSHHR